MITNDKTSINDENSNKKIAENKTNLQYHQLPLFLPLHFTKHNPAKAYLDLKKTFQPDI